MLSFLSAVVVGSNLGGALISLVVLALVVWLILWAMGELGAPAPLQKVIRVILVVIACLVAIDILLGLGGHGVIFSS